MRARVITIMLEILWRVTYVRAGQKVSVNCTVIADSSLSKLYLPSKELSDSSECRFFEPDYHDQFSELLSVR